MYLYIKIRICPGKSTIKGEVLREHYYRLTPYSRRSETPNIFILDILVVNGCPLDILPLGRRRTQNPHHVNRLG